MRELNAQDCDSMDELHRQVRRESNLRRQIDLVDQIAELLGYPKVDPEGEWARQLVQFICAGTDEESSWAGSVQRKREPEAQTPPKHPEEQSWERFP